MKQFVDRDAARRQAFGVMLAQEIIEHLAVRADAVGPEIVTHQVARLFQPLLDERQRDFGCGCVGELFRPASLACSNALYTAPGSHG